MTKSWQMWLSAAMALAADTMVFFLIGRSMMHPIFVAVFLLTMCYFAICIFKYSNNSFKMYREHATLIKIAFTVFAVFAFAFLIYVFVVNMHLLFGGSL